MYPPIDLPSVGSEPTSRECEICHKETIRWASCMYRTICFKCLANLDREAMLLAGRHDHLYLVVFDKASLGMRGRLELKDNKAVIIDSMICPAVGNNMDKVALVTNFCGTLQFPATSLKESSAGFIGEAIYFWFPGPGGVMWRGVKRGDRAGIVRATQHRYHDITPKEQKIKKLHPLHTFLEIDIPVLPPPNPDKQ